MQQLYEKYRPKRLAQIVGQSKAVGTVRRLSRAGIGGKAFWISGKTGQGKTTLARCIASYVADSFFVREFAAGPKFTADSVYKIECQMQQYSWGRGGHIWIINEAHGLRKDTVRELLDLLERIPHHVVFIFTTTNDGMSLFEDGHLDAGPLLSRCIKITLTSQGIATAFARLVSRIADREGLNGSGMAAYVKLANKEKGNCRAMLQAVAAGEMAGVK